MSARINRPGIYTDMEPQDYHSDPCPDPSLSSSIAVKLLTESPLHAWYAHPRLGKGPREESETFDLGTAAHALILQGLDAFHVVDAADWRTNAAKEQRDAARQIGCIPILAHKMDAVREMAQTIRRQLAKFQETPRPLEGGKPEQTLIWQEKTPAGDIWCRARLDYLHDDWSVIDDLKTVGTSAAPNQFIRTLYGRSGDVQAAFYLRGLRALIQNADSRRGPGEWVEPRFRYIAIENTPPFAASIVGLGPAALAHADDKVQQAIIRWAERLKTNEWPGYPRRTAYADPPAWEIAKWAEESTEGDQ